MLWKVSGKVDPPDHDQGKGDHPELGDGWKTTLVHEAPSFVMITRVAICMTPRTPAA